MKFSPLPPRETHKTYPCGSFPGNRCFHCQERTGCDSFRFGLGRIESAFPPGIDEPKTFRGTIVSWSYRNGYGFVNHAGHDFWFSEPRRFEPGDEVEFEIGQRFGGEAVARNVRKREKHDRQEGGNRPEG